MKRAPFLALARRLAGLVAGALPLAQAYPSAP